MTKETKQDVFNEVLDAFDAAVIEQPGALHQTNQLICYADRYSAATACELPVIPQAVGEIIREDREAGRDLAFVLYEAVRMASRRSRTEGKGLCSWIANNQDTFALAWLLGQWEVADDER